MTRDSEVLGFRGDYDYDWEYDKNLYELKCTRLCFVIDIGAVYLYIISVS